jgi:hypothetical protein
MAFLIGALIVVVAVIAYFMFTGQKAPTKSIDVNVNPPAVSAPAAPSSGG